jgi:hypothetical protein
MPMYLGQGLVLGGGGAMPDWSLLWGGVNEYAVHSAWAMSGYNDKIYFSFTPAVIDGSEQVIFSDTTVNMRLYITTSNVLMFKYPNVAGGVGYASGSETLAAGTVYTGVIYLNADGVEVITNGATASDTDVPALIDITNISIQEGPSKYFNGTIHYLKYTNATLLQSVNAVQGNGVDLYAEIPVLTLTGDFDISFWWKRQDTTGTDQSVLIAPESDTDSAVVVFDSSHAGAPDRLRVIVGGTSYNSNSALANIALGQDCFIRVARVSGQLTVYLDTILLNTFTATGDFEVGHLGAIRGGFSVNAGILQGPTIIDQSGASDVTYRYDLAGNNVSAVPITTDGVASTAGTWQNYDSGVDQVALPQLSRHYPINDGPDALFLEDKLNPASATALVNGDFSNGLTGWAAVASGQTLEVVDGRFHLVTDGTDCNIQQENIVEAGRTYRVTADFESVSGGGLRIVLGNTQTTFTDTGPIDVLILATDSPTRVQLKRNSGASEFYVSNLTVVAINTGAQLFNVAPTDWSK